MLLADLVVSAFVEDDRRVVAIVDDGIAHQHHAVIPTAVIYIFLRIAGRHRHHQTQAVERTNVLFARSDVHPAYEIAVAA